MAHAPPHSLGSVPSDSASKAPKQFGTWQSQRLLGLACSPAKLCQACITAGGTRGTRGWVTAQWHSRAGDRLHRPLGHSLEQSLLLSLESHGHQHPAEVF